MRLKNKYKRFIIPLFLFLAASSCARPIGAADRILPLIWHYDTSSIVHLKADSPVVEIMARTYIKAQEDSLEAGLCEYGKIDIQDSTIDIQQVSTGTTLFRSPHLVDFACQHSKNYLGRAHTHLEIPPYPINLTPSDIDRITAWHDTSGVIYLVLTGIVTDGNGHFGLRVFWALRDGREGTIILTFLPPS